MIKVLKIKVKKAPGLDIKGNKAKKNNNQNILSGITTPFENIRKQRIISPLLYMFWSYDQINRVIMLVNLYNIIIIHTRQIILISPKNSTLLFFSIYKKTEIRYSSLEIYSCNVSNVNWWGYLFGLTLLEAYWTPLNHPSYITSIELTEGVPFLLNVYCKKASFQTN